jgi:hypothetical protein
VRTSPENAALFIKDQAAMTVQRSFDGQTIRALEIAKVNTFDLLNNLLYVTSKALNVKENINEFQAFDIIHTLLEDYKEVKMDEFIYIFKQGKKGIYGPHYNKFDIETIVHWINSYFKSDEYNDHLENRHKKPVEKVELTKEQKEHWTKIAEIAKGIDADLKKKNSSFDGNLKNWLFKASVEQINSLLEDFKKVTYKEGIEAIEFELKNRADAAANQNKH